MSITTPLLLVICHPVVRIDIAYSCAKFDDFRDFFWRQNSLVDDPPLPPEICAQSSPPPFKQHNFDQYLLIAPQPSELAKKVQLALIGYWSRAFQRAIDEPCTLSLSPPKGGTKRDFAIFSSEFQFLSKKSATKFLCVKHSSGKVVAISFLYITVHR